MSVVESYCRSIAIVDDEIYSDRSNKVLSELFFSVSNAFQSEGILCHLFDFKEEKGKEKEKVEEAARLLAAADVAMLDWHLGPNGSEVHAVEILQALSQRSEIHIVLVFTNAPDLSEVSKVLESDILKAKKLPSVKWPKPQSSATDRQPASEQAVDGTKAKEAPIDGADQDVLPTQPIGAVAGGGHVDGYSLESGLIVLVMPKLADARTLSPKDFLQAVQSALMDVFSDHIHWAALEVGARVRLLMPKVTASLPKNIDAALAHQLLYQQEGEVGAQIVEVLLDELRYQLSAEPLRSVSDDVLFESLATRMSTLIEQRQPLSQAFAKVKAIVDSQAKWPPVGFVISSAWRNPELALVRADIAEVESKESEMFPHPPPPGSKKLKASEAAAQYLLHAYEVKDDKSVHAKWAEGRESVIMSLNDPAVQPGLVLVREIDGKFDYFLCVAAACDCAHPKGALPFLKGKGISLSDKTEKSGYGQTQTCVKGKQITWYSSQLETIKADPLPAEFTKLGVLRPAFTARIIQRLWSYQSRVGVDSSECIRQRRAED